jgi:hypothetical protein
VAFVFCSVRLWVIGCISCRVFFEVNSVKNPLLKSKRKPTEQKNQSVKPVVSQPEPNKKTLQQQPKKRGEKKQAWRSHTDKKSKRKRGEKQNRQRRTKGD